MNILIIGEDKPGRGSTGYLSEHFKKIKKILTRAEISLTINPGEINRLLPTANIIITAPTNVGMINLERAKKLMWIHLSSAGVTDAAKLLKDTKIILTNSSGVHPIPISEHVAAYMLMFARQMTVSYRMQIEKKKWLRNIQDYNVFELRGKTAGIVGFGKIGSKIAKASKGLGMRVVALKHTSKIDDPSVDKSYTDLNNLLAESDFVINALPLTDKTLEFFDMDKFKKMSREAGSRNAGKPSAYFINIGRGKTVVEKDLVKALKTGIIAGAGLDVFEEEPTPDSNPLWNMPNVIMTPHISGWTPEYTNRVIDIFCENVKAFHAHKKLPTEVDKQRGY